MSETAVHGYYMVILKEYDRDSGPQDYLTLYFPTKEMAEKYIIKRNSKNTEKIAPDYYIMARYGGRYCEHCKDW